MTRSNDSGPGDPQEAKLPRRDWILLPALSLLTICVLVFFTEFISREAFSTSLTSPFNCMAIHDPALAWEATPNSVCWGKFPETQLVEYRFNSCGHRAGMECGPKPPGTYRIVMIGSSFGLGYLMAREKTFAALLPEVLMQQTGRKVELYNECMAGRPPRTIALRFNEVLAAKPDMILWELNPWDVQIPTFEMPEHYVIPQAGGNHTPATGNVPRPVAPASHRTKTAIAIASIPHAVHGVWSHSSSWVWLHALRWYLDTATLIRHYLYESQSEYLRSFLMREDEAGFLRAEPSAEWKDHLQQFDMYAADIEKQAKAAGVPLVVVLVPNRAQAAMISMGEWPADYDPYKLDEELRNIIERHGGTYIDILPDIRTIPNPEQYYLPVDGHPDAQGHAMISRLLAKELTGGAVPALRAASTTQEAGDHGK